MTIQQMQYEFGIQLNQLDNALQLSSDDIEYWLNKAQIELVKEKFTGLNNARRGFEQSPQMVEDLRLLLVKDESETATYDTSGQVLSGVYMYSAPLPYDNLFLLNIRASINYNDTAPNSFPPSTPFPKSKNVPVRFATQDTVYKLLEDPFNKTKVSNPLADLNEDKVTIYTSNLFVVNNVIFNYIRTPREMSIDSGTHCELPEHLHKEIIQRAVDLFLNNTRNLKQRLQRETPVADRILNTENNE